MHNNDSDLKKFLDLYKSFGITLKVEDHSDGHIIHMTVRDHEKFVGYPDFQSEVIFDKDGKFIEQGFYE